MLKLFFGENQSLDRKQIHQPIACYIFCNLYYLYLIQHEWVTLLTMKQRCRTCRDVLYIPACVISDMHV